MGRNTGEALLTNTPLSGRQDTRRVYELDFGFVFKLPQATGTRIEISFPVNHVFDKSA